MLESEKIQKEKDLAGTAKTLCSLSAPECPVVHQTVSGATGWRLVNWPLSGIRRRCTAKNHQTANGRPRNPRVTRGRANGLMGAPDCPVRQRLQIFNSRLRQFRKAICTGTLNRDCPVRHSTEGKNCLPGLLSTAPSCLGAIKGTPRRMKEYTKHSLIIS